MLVGTYLVPTYLYRYTYIPYRDIKDGQFRCDKLYIKRNPFLLLEIRTTISQ